MSTLQKIILVVLIAGLLAGGGFFIFLVQDKEDTQNNIASNNDSTTSYQATDGIESMPFDPIATTNESFVAELQAEDTSNNVSYNGTVSSDGQGNLKLEGTFENDVLTFYALNNEFISCQNETCFSLPTGENGVDTSVYTYSDEKLKEYQQLATYQGESDCPGGLCDTWMISEEGTDITMYITKDKKISKAEGSMNDSSFTISFTYQPVSIVAPDNVLPNPFN